MKNLSIKSLFLVFVTIFTNGLLMTACGAELNTRYPSSARNGNDANPGENPGSPNDPNDPVEPKEEWHWKGALMTGDNSINAFDNGRKKITSLWMEMDSTIQDGDLMQLSMKSNEIAAGALQMSKANLKKALMDLNLGDKDRCILHMTSHGSKSAFYLAGQGGMTPEELDEILDETCGDRPTVVLVSACYSGIFTDSSAMQQDNRIILSAARKDRTSFGCSAEAEYVYWDSCLISNFKNSTSWENLYDNVVACISEKEGSGFTPSLPQKFFGSAVTNLPYLGQ